MMQLDDARTLREASSASLLLRRGRFAATVGLAMVLVWSIAFLTLATTTNFPIVPMWAVFLVGVAVLLCGVSWATRGQRQLRRWVGARVEEITRVPVQSRRDLPIEPARPSLIALDGSRVAIVSFPTVDSQVHIVVLSGEQLTRVPLKVASGAVSVER